MSCSISCQSSKLAQLLKAIISRLSSYIGLIQLKPLVILQLGHSIILFIALTQPKAFAHNSRRSTWVVLIGELLKENEVDLYKSVFPPDYPSLAVIGLIEPIEAIAPIAELQSRWVAAVFSGRVQLPSKQMMRNDIDHTRILRTQRQFICLLLFKNIIMLSSKTIALARYQIFKSIFFISEIMVRVKKKWLMGLFYDRWFETASLTIAHHCYHTRIWMQFEVLGLYMGSSVLIYPSVEVINCFIWYSPEAKKYVFRRKCSAKWIELHLKPKHSA